MKKLVIGGISVGVIVMVATTLAVKIRGRRQRRDEELMSRTKKFCAEIMELDASMLVASNSIENLDHFHDTVILFNKEAEQLVKELDQKGYCSDVVVNATNYMNKVFEDLIVRK